MKPALLLIFSFLLFAFTTKLPLTSAAEQVVDINGDPIFPGGQYYIVSSIRGAGGGGVRPGKTENSACPVSVIQEQSDLRLGVPVKFTIPGISPGIIFTGTSLEIAFTKKPRCAESSKWVVVDDSGKSRVGIGGPEDHPNDELLSGVFRIEKSRFAYKLVFCPTITAPPGRCFDIGRQFDEKDGVRRLILTDEGAAFDVVFVDATPAGNSVM